MNGFFIMVLAVRKRVRDQLASDFVQFEEDLQQVSAASVRDVINTSELEIQSSARF